MRLIARMTVGIMLVWLPACASDKAELREPLAVGSTVPRAVTEHNNQGIQDYKVSRYQEAKTNFQRAVIGAPDSAEAHYNLALALFALGESSEAREHFLHAADLAPGHRVIWDSPALRPYGAVTPAEGDGGADYMKPSPIFGSGGRSK